MLELSRLFDDKKEEKLNQIMLCDDVSFQYGMVLKKEDILKILDTQESILYELERVEFDSSIIESIIYAFCNSCFISKYEYAESINKLVEIFYYYREELDEKMSDETIIEYIHRAFDGPCQGSFASLEDGRVWQLMNALENRADIYWDDEYGCF